MNKHMFSHLWVPATPASLPTPLCSLLPPAIRVYMHVVDVCFLSSSLKCKFHEGKAFVHPVLGRVFKAQHRAWLKQALVSERTHC